VRLHPNLARVYRGQVERRLARLTMLRSELDSCSSSAGQICDCSVIEAFSDNAQSLGCQAEAVEIMRSLIDRSS
jgi:hypothetical protein